MVVLPSCANKKNMSGQLMAFKKKMYKPNYVLIVFSRIEWFDLKNDNKKIK